MLDLDAIEARVEAADPAPWYLSDLDTAWEDHKPVIARLDSSVITRHEPSHPPTLSSPNVQFVLHARTDIPALVAELRAAREVVEAAHKWKSALTWDAEWSIRPAEVGSTLQRKSELLEALAAPAGAHVHYDDFYDPAGELDDDFDAYRAVVGPE